MSNTIQNSQLQACVHCGNLSIKTTQDDLYSLFSVVVPVKQVVIKPRKDNASAFAFIYLETEEDCEVLISKFNHYPLHGKQLNLTAYNPEKNYPPNCNIFVKNLPKSLNSKDLQEIFKMFGQIASCKVASNENGELKGYGYVQYKNAASAQKAIDHCKNVMIENNNLVVEYYIPRDIKGRKPVEKAVVFTNVYAKNFPSTMTEESLRPIFEQFGKITSFYLPIGPDGLCVGYACVNYQDPADALNAIKNLNNVSLLVDDTEVKMFVAKAEDKKTRDHEIKKYENISGEIPTNKRNLYISNIPDSFTAAEIKEIFTKYGTIIDFKLGSNPKTHVQYGYVCYDTQEEAFLASEKLEDTYLDGNKLYISYYKTKFERSMENLSLNADRRSEGKDKRLYETVLERADRYNEYWKALDVGRAEDFAQKVMKRLDTLPQRTIKKLTSDTEALDKSIRLIVEDYKKRGGLFA